MSTLERAIAIAAEAHRGQKDKAGEPYLLHPLRLMLQMQSETDKIVAVLHDVVEDSHWTLDDLRSEGFSAEVLEAVGTLTKRNGASYEEYVHRIKTNPIARRVKLADLRDNMDISRISDVTEHDLKRLRKYHKAWRRLRQQR